MGEYEGKVLSAQKSQLLRQDSRYWKGVRDGVLKPGPRDHVQIVAVSTSVAHEAKQPKAATANHGVIRYCESGDARELFASIEESHEPQLLPFAKSAPPRSEPLPGGKRTGDGNFSEQPVPCRSQRLQRRQGVIDPHLQAGYFCARRSCTQSR